jgi:1-acyl-sn-glycerol-3-phosphate acyltransferase
MSKNVNKKTAVVFFTSLTFWVLFVIPLPIYFLLSLIAFPLGQKIRYRIMITLCYFYCWVMRYICGVKYQVVNPENIPHAPCVVVSNHQSMWETCTLTWIFTDIVFILKKEILRVPLFGWGINGIAPIAIDRSKGDLAMAKIKTQGQQRMAAGFSLLLFPEGTRMKVGKRKDFKYGAVKIATLLKTTITPVALNSGICWPKKSFFIYPGTITVVVGNAMTAPESEDECVEMTQKIQAWVYNELNKIGG